MIDGCWWGESLFFHETVAVDRLSMLQPTSPHPSEQYCLHSGVIKKEDMKVGGRSCEANVIKLPCIHI